MNKIRVAGAIASKSGITLYLEDGTQMELVKESHRTNEIMQEIAKPLARKEIVEIDLARYSAHAAIENKTGGFIRFAIQKVKDFVGMGDIETGGVLFGQIVKENETIVAHVGDKKIPGAGALQTQIERAAHTKDCKGFKRFMERLATVIDDRGHSVQELLNFMKSADLPIADDGSIVAYKTLNYAYDLELEVKLENVFADCHSGTVRQKVGSRVSMPMDEVDDSRRVQCSTGLHIARRNYISWYRGDVLTLVKVAPEDVIAVPSDEPNKMRAMAYHIVALLSETAFTLIKRQQPMTSDKASAKLLADVSAGDHIGVIEEVRIGEKKENAQSQYDKEIVVEQKEDVRPFLGAGDNGMADALSEDDNSDEGDVDIRSLNQKIEEVQKEREEAEAERDKALKELAELKSRNSKVKKKRTKKKAANKPEKPTETPKPVDPAPEAPTDAQKRREDAYKAVMGGMSQRQASVTYHVCAKTLRKMIKERAQKAAE